MVEYLRLFLGVILFLVYVLKETVAGCEAIGYIPYTVPDGGQFLSYLII